MFMESLARAVVLTLGLLLVLGLIGLLLAMRSRRHGRAAAAAALVLSVTQLVVGYAALHTLRPMVMFVLLSPGLLGTVLSVRSLLRSRR